MKSFQKKSTSSAENGWPSLQRIFRSVTSQIRPSSFISYALAMCGTIGYPAGPNRNSRS